MRKSSKERVKAINAPEKIPGRMSGKVTFQKIFQGGAPRSLAASSKDSSKPWSLDFTVMITYETLKVTCAKIIEKVPSTNFKTTNQMSNERPKTISGIISGM